MALVDARRVLQIPDSFLGKERESGIPFHLYLPAIVRDDVSPTAQADAMREILLQPTPGGRRRLYVGNLGQLWRLRALLPPGSLYGEPEMNLYNESARELGQALGLVDAMPPLEAGTDVAGWLPLMVTAHAMAPGRLIDRKGEEFLVRPLGSGEETRILGSVPPAALLRSDGEGPIRLYIA